MHLLEYTSVDYGPTAYMKTNESKEMLDLQQKHNP